MNEEIVSILREIADLLEIQNANYYRVSAYRRAANTIESLGASIKDLVEDRGIAGLTSLPGIGEGIARLIYEYIATGKINRLETLRGEHDPIGLLKQIPGIGNAAANEIYEKLHIDSVEALEVAAYNGRLEKLPQIGKKRLASIRAWLNTVMGSKRYSLYPNLKIPEPSVSTLLGIDLLYRSQSTKGQLPKIAPKRFNPSARAWLPVLHTSRNDWHFTAMYSNTRRAHELGRINDWVVIYYYDKYHHGGQCTAVTEIHGNLTGKRVIRGRELECEDYYSHKVAS